MAVPPSISPGFIRLRLPSQSSASAVQPPRRKLDSTPELFALEQSLRQLIQSLLETGIMVHDLEEGGQELLFGKMYSNSSIKLMTVTSLRRNYKKSNPQGAR
jgi:hypothetical protein